MRYTNLLLTLTQKISLQLSFEKWLNTKGSVQVTADFRKCPFTQLESLSVWQSRSC